MVRSADREGDVFAREALATLLRDYWFPLYAHARRRGASRDDSCDLVQGFFARLIEKSHFARASPELGRFRSYLLGAFDHYLANAADHARAAKRGAGRVVSLDAMDAEARRTSEPMTHLTPEVEFLRRWTSELLAGALDQLRSEHARFGRIALFDGLLPYLAGEEDAPAAAAAAPLGLTPGALRVALHRFRRRYREIVRARVADTLAEPREVDDELRRLTAAFEE
jgi:RNA polymerase sigma-70 factor (ECF subfamily)